MLYTIFKQGEKISFNSNFTDQEAITIIKDVNSNFHQSLVKSYNYYKTGKKNARPLSEKQTAWVHYLAVQKKNDNKAICTLKFDKIWEALHKPSKLQNPSFLINNIKFAIPFHKDKKHLVAIIYNRNFIGYVNNNFEFFGKNFINNIKDEIEHINSDFISAVKNHGLKTGNCCFCRKPLSTPDSLYNGYGKTCAGHYDMPYLNQKTIVDII